MPAAQEAWSELVPLGGPERAGESFELGPDAETRAALAERLEISAIRKLRFTGRLVPEGRQDWRLEGELGATVVQPCSVTLAPVVTRIDVPVTRRFVANLSEPEAGETEMPEDDEVEPLPAVLDLGAVMAEALALALPDFPRAEGADFGAVVYAEPGVEPLTDDKLKPLAGLAALKERLEKPE